MVSIRIEVLRRFASTEEKESLLQLASFTVLSLMLVKLYEIYTFTCMLSDIISNRNKSR